MSTLTETDQRSALRRWGRRFLLMLLGLFILSPVPMIVMKIGSLDAVVQPYQAPKRDAALVLGAGLSSPGRPSDVLEARVQTAVSLYNAKLVRKLIMSGDNSIAGYDEVTAMKDLAVKMGVQTNDVILDYAGFRTLDSCARVRKVFGQERVILVTQGFHLPRAIHLCRYANLEVFGVEARDPRSWSRRLKSGVREIPASIRAVLDANVFRRDATVLGPAIDIDNPPPEALKQPLA